MLDCVGAGFEEGELEGEGEGGGGGGVEGDGGLVEGEFVVEFGSVGGDWDGFEDARGEGGGLGVVLFLEAVDEVVVGDFDLVDSLFGFAGEVVVGVVGEV